MNQSITPPYRLDRSVSAEQACCSGRNFVETGERRLLDKGDLRLIGIASGHGRELFFSNIIAYIACHFKDIFSLAISEAAQCGTILSSGYDEVKREKNHYDITFNKRARLVSKNAGRKRKKGEIKEIGVPVLVVENKSGTLGSSAQLIKYRNNIKRNTESLSSSYEGEGFVMPELVLLTPCQYDEEVAREAGWRHIQYKELADSLIRQFDKYGLLGGKSFESVFLRATLNYMKKYQELLDSNYDSLDLSMKVRDLWKVEDSVLDDLAKDDGRKDSLKLLIVKHRYAKLSALLRDRLRRSENCNPAQDGQDAETDHNDSSPIRVKYSMGSNTPLVEVSIKGFSLCSNANQELKGILSISSCQEFFCQLQNGSLNVGFGIPGIFDFSTEIRGEKSEKVYKKEFRARIWTGYGMESALKAIIESIESATGALALKPYSSNGYMTRDYVMPMAQIEGVSDLTLDEVIDLMAQIGIAAMRWQGAGTTG